MGLIQDILTKRTALPAAATVVSDSLQKSAPVKTADSSVSEAPVKTTIPASTNRFGYDDETMEYLGRSGYTPEVLERISNFDPAGSPNYIEELYKSTTPAPKAPNEKKIKSARTIAGIGDALGLISQMVSVGRGAYAPVRSFEGSATDRTQRGESRLRDLYKGENSRYEAGAYDARLRGLLDAMTRNQKDRAAVDDIVTFMRKEKQDKEQFDANLAEKVAGREQGQANADRKHELDVKRTGAYITNIKSLAENRRTSGGAGSGNKGSQMVFPANPNDPDAVIDNLGRRVRVFNITPAEQNGYYAEAMQDDDFLNRHPEFRAIVQPTPEEVMMATRKGSVAKPTVRTHNAAKMAEIAATYARETQYDPLWQEEIIYPTNNTVGYSPYAMDSDISDDGYEWLD